MGRLALSLGVILWLSGLCIAADKTSPMDSLASVRKAIDSYVEAYNRGDAGAVASHWGRQGEYVSTAGERLKGPDKIKPALEDFFAQNQGIQMKVAVFDVQEQPADRSTSRGIAVVGRKGGEPEEIMFTAVHVREDGAWKLFSIEEEESAVPFATIAQLGQLEWLIGEWVDQDEESTVETTFKWSGNYAFINGSFRVTVKGRLDVEGTQVIGWDPSAKRIRSWIFDSKGGFGEGVWTRDGNRWAVNVKSLLSNGQKASSVNVYTYVDPDTFKWHSTGREVDGELLPNIEEVTVVRKRTHPTMSGSGK